MTYFLTSPRQSGSGPLLGSVGLWREKYGNGGRASDGNFLMGSNGKLLASIWGQSRISHTSTISINIKHK